MSRNLDLDDLSKLSDDDRQYAIQRGLISESEAEAARFGQGNDTGATYPVAPSVGLNGNEPSATADRTTVSGVGLAASQVNLNQPVPTGEEEEQSPSDPAESDGEEEESNQPGDPGSYENKTLDELRLELEKRELSKSGNKAELVARLTADDADKDGE